MSDLAFYQQHYQDLFDPLLDTMSHGIRVDQTRAAEKLARLRARCDAIREQLAELAGANICDCNHMITDHYKVETNINEGKLRKDGKPRAKKIKTSWPCDRCKCANYLPTGEPLHAEKDLSNQKVVAFLYNATGTALGLPKQRRREDNSVTADEIALRKLVLKVKNWEPKPPPKRKVERKLAPWQHNPERALEVLTLLLEHREKFKLCAYLEPDKLDPDGRLRCMYKNNTHPGRLASAKNPLGTGYNLQNVPRGELRECFLPDEGCLLLETDYSQIEDRMVKVLSKDPEMIRQARLSPLEFDAHSAMAQRIFSILLGIPPAEVDVGAEVTPGNSRRQIAKPARHGRNYNEGVKKLQETLLKDGVVLDLDTCKRIHTAAGDRSLDFYHFDTRRRIMRDHRLVSSWGRTLNFEGERLNDDTYRRGYAWRAATENADCLNQLGFVPLYNWLRSNRMQTKINLQVHDSLVMSCPPDELYDVAAYLDFNMSQTRKYEGVELAVPVGFKLGIRWGCKSCENCQDKESKRPCLDVVEWKALPTREEMEATAARLLRRQERIAA